MNPITSITQGCDFTLRIRAKRVATRGYVNVSFTEIADIHVNLVNLPATKTPIAYTIDSEGRLLLDIDGETLNCNSYGIEILGYYNNGNWRHQLAPAFQIVRTSTEDNYALNESDERTIDLIIVIGETYLTTKGFNQAMEEHDQDIHAHNDLRSTIASMSSQISSLVTEVANAEDGIGQMQQEVAEAGYQNAQDVKEAIEEAKPTKVSELTNDLGFQNASQVQQKVDAAKITSVRVTVDGGSGTPSGTGSVSGNQLDLALHNIQGQKGDPGESIVGPRGPQGATSVYDQTTQQFLTTLETTTGQSQTKTMTQKAITDELMNDRIYYQEEIDISKYLVSRWIINSNGKWSQSSKATTGSSYIFAINPGETFKVEYDLPANKAGNVEFFATYNGTPPPTEDPDFASGIRIEWLEDYLPTYYFTAPPTAHFMYIRGLAGSGDDRTPTRVSRVTRTKDLIDKIPALISSTPQSLNEEQRAQAWKNFGVAEAVNGGKANYLPGLTYSAASTTAYVLASAEGCNVMTEFIPIGPSTKAIWYFGQQVNNITAQAIIYDSNKQPINYWNMGVANVENGYRDISGNYTEGYIRFSFFDYDINGYPLKLVAEVNGVKYYKHGATQSVMEEKDKHWRPLILGKLVPNYIDTSGNIGLQSAARAATHDMIVFPKTNCRLRFKAPSEDFFIKVWMYNSRGTAATEARNPRTQGKWFFDGDTYTVPSDKSCYRILFTLRDAEMTEGYIQSLIDNGKIAIEYYDEDESNLFDRNSHMENFARNAMRRLMNPTTPAGIKASNPNNIPTFAHTSDVHGDAARLKNFIEYSKYLGVDGIVNTGDTCNYSHSHGATFQNVLSAGCGNYLFAVGNHDKRDIATGEDVFTDIVESLVDDNGYLEASSTPTTHTYWYRDFDAKKIRVISIDYYATGYPGLGQAQLSWFVDTLAATPTGYGVIILMHSPEDAVRASEGYDKFMQPSPKYGDIFEPNGTYIDDTHPIRDIVDAFISRDTVSISYTDNEESVSVSANFSSVDASTEFIAYMAGHRHEDNVGYYGNSVNIQLCLNVVCGTGMYGDATHAAWANQSDLMRGDVGVTQDAFNVYGIDRENGEIRIARIGATVTERMEVRDFMIIPYK